MFWKKRKIACDPYSGLAPIYDFVMRHVDYQGWTDYLEEIFSRHGSPGKQVLELACGTGNITLELARRGYKVVGTDISDEMLNVARQKANSAGLPVLFRQMDMRHINIAGHFDIVLCLYDSINYLMQEQEIEKVLQEVHALLAAKGIFVFDICTEINSLRYFSNRVERERGKDFSYWRHSYYLRSSRTQVTEFRIKFAHQDKLFTEVHQQRIYRVDEILQLIERSAFTSMRFYDSQTFRPGSENSDRIHFVLHK